MSKTTKKALIIAGISLDAILTIFFFVISIIMIVKTNQMQDWIDVKAQENNGLIGYLQNHTTVYLVGFVIPLFVLLAVNIIALVMYVKKSDKKEVTVADLSDEQKEALKKQLMEELSKK